MIFTDKLTKEQQHRCMAAIKGKNTKPELLVRKFLFSRGFRYRLKLNKNNRTKTLYLVKLAIFALYLLW